MTSSSISLQEVSHGPGLSTGDSPSDLVLPAHKQYLTQPHPPRHSSSSSITTDIKYNMLLCLEFPSHLKERLAIPETFTIVLRHLPFSQIYIKTPILGVLSVIVSILGGTVVTVIVPDQYWLLLALLLK